MNILFLHGLESPLSDDKRNLLECFGKVAAPDIDYKSDIETIKNLHDAYQNANIDLIIGSSMGGFAGFYLSMILDVPALLFNPALPYRSVEQQIPDRNYVIRQPVSIVLGKLDTIIKAIDTKAFLAQHFPDSDLTMIERADLEHRIPLDIFTDEVSKFINSIE